MYRFLGVCLRPAALRTGAVVSALRRLVSPSFPRSGEVGGLAGEVVESPVFCSDLASLAGLGGEGRRRWELMFWLLVVLVVFFVRAAPAGRGGEGSGRLKIGWLLLLDEVALVGLLRRLSRVDAVGDAAEVLTWLAMVGSGCSGPDRMRFELGVCRRPMFLQCVADPLLRNWWTLRLVKAFWRGVPPLPGFVFDGVFFAGVRAGGVQGRWCEVEDEDGPQGSFLLHLFLVFLYFCAFGCRILTTV
jgi:hypothetical protein